MFNACAGSSPVTRTKNRGMAQLVARSEVEHFLGKEEVVSSNLATPTKTKKAVV